MDEEENEISAELPDANQINKTQDQELPEQLVLSTFLYKKKPKLILCHEHIYITEALSSEYTDINFYYIWSTSMVSHKLNFVIICNYLCK